MNEHIFDKQINYGWGKTFNMTGKAPIVSKRIFDKLSNAYGFINDYNDSAIEGLLLSVINDGDKNGVYRVAKIATKAGEEGSLIKLVDQDAFNAIVNDFNIFIIPENNELPTPSDAKEGKIYLIQTESSTEGNVYTEYIVANDAWEILGEYRATVDLSPYYKKTEVDDLISNTEGKLIFGGGENNTIVGKNGHESNFKFRPSTSFESDINSKGTSVISQNLDKIEFKNDSKSVTLNSNGFYYGVTSNPYNQIATINDIKNKIPTNISYFENKDGEIVPSSGSLLFNTSNEEGDDLHTSDVSILPDKVLIKSKYNYTADEDFYNNSEIEINSNGHINLTSNPYHYMGRKYVNIEITPNGAYYKYNDPESDGSGIEGNREIATKADINTAIEGVIAGDLTSALTNYVHVDNIVEGNIDSYTGNASNHVASVKHTHNYISSNSETELGSGDSSISFENGNLKYNIDNTIGLEITSENGGYSKLYSNDTILEVNNKYVTFNKGKNTLTFDGDLKVGATKVSLEGHTHNYESIIVDENTYLSEYIDSLERRIASLESIISALTIDGASIITTSNIENYAVTPKNIPNYAVTSIHTNGNDIALDGYSSEGYYSGIVSINLAGISNIAFDDAIEIDANVLGAE